MELRCLVTKIENDANMASELVTSIKYCPYGRLYPILTVCQISALKVYKQRN